MTQCDISEHALLRGIRSAREAQRSRGDGGGAAGDAGGDVDTCHVMADEEFLPFPPSSFDLVLRCAHARGRSNRAETAVKNGAFPLDALRSRFALLKGVVPWCLVVAGVRSRPRNLSFVLFCTSKPMRLFSCLCFLAAVLFLFSSLGGGRRALAPAVVCAAMRGTVSPLLTCAVLRC